MITEEMVRVAAEAIAAEMQINFERNKDALERYAKTALTAALAAMWQDPNLTLPKKPGLRNYEYVDCLILYKGEVLKRPWNCEHLCWDDEHYDDFFCSPTDPTAWMLLPAPSQLSKRDDAERDSPQEAAEDGEDWVYLWTFRHYSIDLERLEQDILDDHHEDASVHELRSFDALMAAVKAFNEAQTSGSFDEDRSRRARVSHLRDEEEHSLSEPSS